jgi:hypothetical protein
MHDIAMTYVRTSYFILCYLQHILVVIVAIYRLRPFWSRGGDAPPLLVEWWGCSSPIGRVVGRNCILLVKWWGGLAHFRSRGGVTQFPYGREEGSSHLLFGYVARWLSRAPERKQAP